METKHLVYKEDYDDENNITLHGKPVINLGCLSFCSSAESDSSVDAYIKTTKNINQARMKWYISTIPLTSVFKRCIFNQK